MLIRAVTLILICLLYHFAHILRKLGYYPFFPPLTVFYCQMKVIYHFSIWIVKLIELNGFRKINNFLPLLIKRSTCKRLSNKDTNYFSEEFSSTLNYLSSLHGQLREDPCMWGNTDFSTLKLWHKQCESQRSAPLCLKAIQLYLGNAFRLRSCLPLQITSPMVCKLCSLTCH